jgi:hypothetical protein
MIWSLAFLLNLSQIRHSKREFESISIVSKLTLVILDFVFHSYFASHFRLLFYAEISNLIILGLCHFMP